MEFSLTVTKLPEKVKEEESEGLTDLFMNIKLTQHLDYDTRICFVFFPAVTRPFASKETKELNFT